MNTITKRIEIDLYSPTSYEVVIAQQGDNISRTIEFVLYNQGEPYLFTDKDHEILAVIGGRRGDHSSFMKECSLTDNVITAVLDSSILYEAGAVQAKIFLYDSNTDTILSTIPFLISVQEDPSDKNRMEAEKSSAFDWLILQFQKLKSSFSSHITDFLNPHQVTKDQVGLGNVPNVTTNDQTPTYEAPDDLSELSSGETLSSAFGKLSKTVSEFIVQKDKLDGIESGAEVNVQPDWNITDSESDAYIKNKPSIYTAAEIDNKFSSLETNIDWKESVGAYNDIAAAYPNPQDGWTVNVQDTDYTYRYNGTDWIAISANAIPKATSSVDGLFSKEDYVKFESLYSGGVAGVKGNAESRYRTGNVNLTAENVGALPNTMGATINSAYNQANAAYDLANISYDSLNSDSLCLGNNAKYPGYMTTAVGGGACAAGNCATAYGCETNAAGYDSTALGYGAHTDRNATASIALGCSANAVGNHSTALGSYTHARGNYSTALGSSANISAASTNTIQLGNASSLSTLSCRVALTVTSDERDKADIAEIGDGAVEFLNRIHAIRYVFNHRELYIDEEHLSDEEKEKKEKFGLCGYDREAHEKGTRKGSRMRVGVSAQETQKALEEVYGSSNYANLINDNLFDLDAEDIPEGVENQLSANYEGFIPFLIKAVQELDKRTRALETAAEQKILEESIEKAAPSETSSGEVHYE